MAEQSDFLYKMEQVIFLEDCAVKNSVSHACRMEKTPCWEIGTERDLIL